MVKIIAATQNSIEKAADILRNGGIVAMPTETVYGLAGNALDDAAVEKIFLAKGRPNFNPLISHFAKLSDIEQHANIDERVKLLAMKFWPGPLTMILPRKKNSTISNRVTAGLDTIAVRIPAHKTARDLIAAAGIPLAAPSANPSGKLSPTSAMHVAQTLGSKIDMILAGGSSEVGLESTIIDLSTDKAIILRHGAIMQQDLEECLNQSVGFSSESSDIKSPGQLLKHYAPSKPIRLNAIDIKSGEALLAFGSIKFMADENGVHAKGLSEDLFRNLSENADLHEAASNLFQMLHDLDKSNASQIAVMNIPDRGLGLAINDRLKRATN